MDVDSLVALLESGSFDTIQGVTEGAAVDFKQQPYSLTTDKGKFELAKDVAAFANGRKDSIIIIGVETETSADSPFERAKRPRPIRNTLLNPKKHRDQIRSRCYPTIRELSVELYPSVDDQTRSLLAIRIPVQREEDRPFLVLSPLSSSGDKVQGWLFALPTRALDETEHLRESALHEAIVRGRTLAPRIDHLVVALAQHVPPINVGAPALPSTVPDAAPTSSAAIARRLLSRVERATESLADDPDGYGEAATAPTLSLAAAPTQAVIVPTIFSETGVRSALESPPVTRSQGWNMFTGDRAEIVAGTHLRLGKGRSRLLELYDDGTLLACARLDRLLVAGRRANSGLPESQPVFLKLNSLALVEYIHDFVLAFFALLNHFEPHPTRARFEVVVRSAIGSSAGNVHLPPHGINSPGWQFADAEDVNPPDVPDFAAGLEAPTNDDADVPKIALQLLQRLYPFFKRTTEQIPYLTEARDAVDPVSFSARK